MIFKKIGALRVMIWLVGILLVILLVVMFGVFSRADRLVLLSANKSLSYNGIERTYRTFAPRGEIKKIVIGFHGFGDTSRRFAYYTGLHNVTDSQTLVVYPQAIDPQDGSSSTGWNAGFCCGSGWVQKSDDIGYIDTLIETVKREYSAQDAKIYLSGFSNGAFFAQRYAAERPNIVSGVAVSSGTIGTESKRLEPTGPVPILLMHGEQDERVTFGGGSASMDPEFDWLSFAETTSAWESTNGQQAPVKTITYPNNGHKWDGWRLLNFWHKRPNASIEAVNFFDSL